MVRKNHSNIWNDLDTLKWQENETLKLGYVFYKGNFLVKYESQGFFYEFKKPDCFDKMSSSCAEF